MRGSVGNHRVVAYALALVLLSAVAAADQETSDASPRICLSREGTPTDRCFEPRRYGFRLSPAEAGGYSRTPAAELVFEAGRDDSEMIEVFADLATGGEAVEICVVDGFNICPPEPFEIVWVCITTGMLAGSSCPEMPEDEEGAITTILLRTAPP